MNWPHWAEYHYNASFHTPTQMTPFKAVYGRESPRVIKYGFPSSPIDSIDQMLYDRDSTLELLKSNLHKAQMRMKNQADKHRREVELEVGDWVFIKIRPYRMRSISKRLNEKQGPEYFGPYAIKERIGRWRTSSTCQKGQSFIPHSTSPSYERH